MSYQIVLVNAPMDMLLDSPEIAYTLRLGRIDVGLNTNTRVVVQFTIFDGAAAQAPFAGLVSSPFRPDLTL